MNVFKMVIEFALEYRTNRDKILQTRKRLAEKRERNKTRGMMIGVAKQAAQTNGFDVQLRRLPDGMGDQAVKFDNILVKFYYRNIYFIATSSNVTNVKQSR